MSLATVVRVHRSEILESETGDEKIIELWMMTRTNPNTRRSYERTITTFLPFVPNGLQSVKLEQLAAWCNSIAHLSAASRQTKISTIRSLFKFMHEVGFIQIDLTRFLKPPKVPNQLAARIIPEDKVLDLIYAPPAGSRDSVILRLLYSTGCRASELVNLNWGDLQPRGLGRYQVHLRGKGDKNRSVVIESPATAKDLLALRNGALDDAPMFKSRRYGRRLQREDIFRLVRKWAEAAGVETSVCVHTLRHCHATYALEHGCPITEVAVSLGHSDINTTQRYLHVRPGRSSGRFVPMSGLKAVTR